MENNENIKKIISGSLIIILGLFIGKFLNYIFRLIIARLGPDQYGLFSLGLSVVSFGAILALMGLDRGTLRFVSYYLGTKDQMKIKGVILYSLKFSIITSLIFSILIFIFAPQISVKIFHNDSLIKIIKILAFSIPAYVLSEVLLSIIRAYREVKYVVYSKNLLEGLSKIVLSLIAIYFGYALFGISLAYVISLVVTFVVTFYFIEKKLFPIFKKDVKTEYNNKQIFSYSWPLMISNIMELALIWVDTILLGYFKTSSEVGIYNAAFPTAMLLTSIPVAILTLFTPTMSKLIGEKRIEEQKEIFNITSKWIFLAALPVSIIIMYLSKDILKLLFGSSYASGYLALSILAFGFLISAVSFTSRKLLEVYKKSNLILINSMIAIVLNVALNIILIPKFDIIGAAISSAISFIVYSGLFIMQSISVLKFRHPIMQYFKIILASVFSLVILILVRLYLIKNSIILIVIYGLIYLLLAYLLKIIHKEEFNLLRSLKDKNQNNN